LIDSYRHKGLRNKLIKTLEEKGIQNPAVLAAIKKIPRHFFLDKAFEDWAYKDIPFPIGNEQTISQPFTVAYQSSILEVKTNHKVLEIGTGSGYQACVLSELAAKVYTIERQENLFHKTNQLLKQIGYTKIRTFWGDGYKGLPRQAPFDRIIVTAGAPFIPKKLTEQLAIGGKLVIPVGDKSQKMIRLTRTSKTKFEKEEFGDFQFVPFLKGVNKS
jgi:protein-L-isoaspartate(D-aspartate) O-methyltransferase